MRAPGGGHCIGKLRGSNHGRAAKLRPRDRADANL